MFCKNCGAQLAPNAYACTQCDTAAGQGFAYCANCGAPLAAGAGFCANCGTPAQAAAPVGNKSKLAAGLLAILLGHLGIHNFYLGYTKTGVIQLLITVLLSWTGIGPLAVWIWAIVEGVKIFNGQVTDANGNRLRD